MRNRLDLPENTEVLLYFSENTDMRKLEKELLEIYGPGKSKSDIYSLYENSINRVKRTEPYMFQNGSDPIYDSGVSIAASIPTF